MSYITIHELEYQNMIRMAHDLQEKNAALKFRIEKLREALEFYASTINWDNHLNYNNDMIDSEDLELIENMIEGVDCSDYYGGKAARAALKADEEVESGN